MTELVLTTERYISSVEITSVPTEDCTVSEGKTTKHSSGFHVGTYIIVVKAKNVA